MRHCKRGQVTAELAVLFAFVIGGFVAMGFYLQRGVQGSTKANADAVGSQYSTTAGYSSYVASDTHEAISGTTTSTSCSETEHALGTPGAPAIGTDCGGRVLDDAKLKTFGSAPDVSMF